MASKHKKYLLHDILETDRSIFDIPEGSRVSIVRPFMNAKIDTTNADERISTGLFPEILVKILTERTLDFFIHVIGEKEADGVFKDALKLWQDTAPYKAEHLQSVRIDEGRGFVMATPDEATQIMLEAQREEAAKNSSGLGFVACNLAAGIGIFENTYWAKRAIELVQPHLLGRAVTLGPAIPFVEEM